MISFEKEKKEFTCIRTSQELRDLLNITVVHVKEKHGVFTSHSSVIEKLLKEYLKNENVKY